LGLRPRFRPHLHDHGDDQPVVAPYEACPGPGGVVEVRGRAEDPLAPLRAERVVDDEREGRTRVGPDDQIEQTPEQLVQAPLPVRQEPVVGREAAARPGQDGQPGHGSLPSQQQPGQRKPQDVLPRALRECRPCGQDDVLEGRSCRMQLHGPALRSHAVFRYLRESVGWAVSLMGNCQAARRSLGPRRDPAKTRERPVLKSYYRKARRVLQRYEKNGTLGNRATATQRARIELVRRALRGK
jgi:hypothetical protein